MIWLDLALPLILRRLIARSWKRWRSQELLWGTNTESFWVHLKLWSKDSLIHWAVQSHLTRHKRYMEPMSDPQWAHIRFVRLRSPREVERFVANVERSVTAGSH